MYSIILFVYQQFHMALDDLVVQIPILMDCIHDGMFKKAYAELTKNIVLVKDIDGLCAALDNRSLAIAPFCCNHTCEGIIREQSSRYCFLMVFAYIFLFNLCS